MNKLVLATSGLVMSLFASAAVAEGGAPAGAAGQPGSPFGSLFLLVGMVVLFYFILIRPQQKRMKEHRKLISELTRGDEVVTSGGILGKITDVGEQYLLVEIADNVEIRIQNSAVASVLPKGSINAASK